MPLAFGAVHRQYAAGDDAPASWPSSIAAAHDRDLEVWLDVVYNHTTEIDAGGPTYSFRGLADGDYYRLAADGSYIETTGCGNDIDTSSPAAQDLILLSLDRYADLGVDGFRFDLAPVLSRHEPFVARLDEWATRRGVRMIAEPWDAAGTYELGRAWPGRGWMQWNDRYREDVRGFLRGEGGLVTSLIQRVQGSPDLFDTPTATVNFLTCHDGFTLYDLVAYDRKHNEANGHANHDGAGDNRSWNCGFEGDDGAPADGPGAPAAPAAQRVVPAGDVARHPDGGDGRRVRAHPGRQQQPVQPGQRHVVGRLAATRAVRRPGALRRPGCSPCVTATPQLAAVGVVGRRGTVVRDVGSARYRRRVTVAGVDSRRSLRHRQRLLGAADVRDPGAGTVAPRRRYLAVAAERHRRDRRGANRRGHLRRRCPHRCDLRTPGGGWSSVSDPISALVSRADPPLYVVTTAVGAERAGCVVGFATQASIDPPRFLVAISVANRTWRVARSATHIAVHLFGRERMDVITLFGSETGDDIDKFADCAWSDGPGGVPVLDGATAWFVGTVLERFDLGDHVGHLLEPIAGGVGTPAGEGIVTLRDGETLEPGHPA